MKRKIEKEFNFITRVIWIMIQSETDVHSPIFCPKVREEEVIEPQINQNRFLEMESN